VVERILLLIVSLFLLDLLVISPAAGSSAAEDPGSADRHAARQKSDPH